MQAASARHPHRDLTRPTIAVAIGSALVVARPWVDLLAGGRKKWKLRSTSTRKHELIGLIAAGTKTVVGVARLVACRGPLNAGELHEAEHLHLIAPAQLHRHPTWCWAWVMDEAQPLSEPVSYPHPAGAQGWVRLGPETALRIAAQLSRQSMTLRRLSQPAATALPPEPTRVSA